MTDPQIWTLIGVFGAVMFAGMTLMTTLFSKVLRAEIGLVGARIDGLETLVNVRFAGVEQRLDRLEARMDQLDADVHAIARKVFPDQ